MDQMGERESVPPKGGKRSGEGAFQIKNERKAR